jgi:hypothetical protein
LEFKNRAIIVLEPKDAEFGAKSPKAKIWRQVKGTHPQGQLWVHRRLVRSCSCPNLLCRCTTTSSASGSTFENRNPANSEDLIGAFPESSTADGLAATANEGDPAWRLVPAPKRAERLFTAAQLLG